MTGTERRSVEELSPEVRSAFRRLVLSLADTKRILGIRYSDWLLGAPSIEAGIAVSSLAQDEWGHARLLYSVLKDFGEDPLEVEHGRSATEYASVDALDAPFSDWAELVAGIVVVDGILSSGLESAGQGRYTPLAGRVSKMLAEEEYHRDLGRAWFRRLAAGAGDAQERLRGAVAGMLPSALVALAPGDAQHRLLVEEGLVQEAGRIRARFWENSGSLLESVGIEGLEAPEPNDGWDPNRSRGAGHPDEEAVERARGDRNRTLFVE